eukprot:scaffold25623_cov106-Skeletonema_marinoi.AAC.1
MFFLPLPNVTSLCTLQYILCPFLPSKKVEVGLVSSRRERDGIFGPGFTSRPETIDPGIPGILMRSGSARLAGS